MTRTAQTVRLSWQWSKVLGHGGSDEDWENVGSTTASYTPKLADVGSYLRATVDYTDVEYDEPDDGLMGVTNNRCAGEAIVCQRQRR